MLIRRALKLPDEQIIKCVRTIRYNTDSGDLAYCIGA